MTYLVGGDNSVGPFDRQPGDTGRCGVDDVYVGYGHTARSDGESTVDHEHVGGAHQTGVVSERDEDAVNRVRMQ